MSGSLSPADPDALRAEIDALLQELSYPGCHSTVNSAADQDESGAFASAEEKCGGGRSDDERGGVELARRAQILDRAHEVLVRALATVDKI